MYSWHYGSNQNHWHHFWCISWFLIFKNHCVYFWGDVELLLKLAQTCFERYPNQSVPWQVAFDHVSIVHIGLSIFQNFFKPVSMAVSCLLIFKSQKNVRLHSIMLLDSCILRRHETNFEPSINQPWKILKPVCNTLN